jgi:hypothetical protein
VPALKIVVEIEFEGGGFRRRRYSKKKAFEGGGVRRGRCSKGEVFEEGGCWEEEEFEGGGDSCRRR